MGHGLQDAAHTYRLGRQPHLDGHAVSHQLAIDGDDRDGVLKAYMSGKWHLGDKPDAFPTEHGFDEVKNFLAYYAEVHCYDDPTLHPWFPFKDDKFVEMYNKVVDDARWQAGVRAASGGGTLRALATKVSKKKPQDNLGGRG